MAKGKATKPRTQDQKAITSFFGGGKKKAEEPPDSDTVADATTDGDDDLSMAEGQSSDVDVNINASNKKSKKEAKSSATEISNLPPINDIPAIFDDLVSRIPDIKQVTEHVKGRKLRIATMCSGTESPLLALELIQKALLEQHGLKFEIEHVFSCEIEPFKQAYIERNFHPPILFRDVCELGDGEAHTAYGALAPVPGDVDMLVAGTSCVDYSNLNTQKQDIDAKGESGQTFRGMMSWVKQHRPPIVILENVCSAPWDKVQTYFEKSGYSAAYARVDTKTYYIPHTRTRVYLIAVNKKNSSIPDTWKDLVTSKLKRPASSTLDAFLLPSDDPRIHTARQKLVQESYGALDRKTGRTDWGRCESRHQRARLEEALGSKRPLTSWDEGGFCKLPDFAWNDWGVGQVERVWDLMDISLLRSAAKGVDPNYKTVVWNLSQNVDRTIGSNKVGICPCLTPSMIPYITNRGGPMVGLEALSMQGLPVDKLLLTRETEDQLADLAGNAMSTTVVGACMLAALVAGKKLLKAGDDSETYEDKNGGLVPRVESESMDVDVPTSADTEGSVVGEESLVQKPLDLSITHACSFSELLSQADKSKRLCSCEGRVDMTTRPLYSCVDCGSSFCKKCGGRPEHNPVPIDTTTSPRVHPSEFAKMLKGTLPMCISLTNVTAELLEGLRQDDETGVAKSLWKSWMAAVLRATESELRFVELKRQEIWSALYRSPTGLLELSLHPQQPEWRLYAHPAANEPTNAEIRQILQSPVGRLACTDDLLSGRWQFALPSTGSIPVKIQGVGELVPSWEARLGLIGEKFKTKMVYPQLKIQVESGDVDKLDRDISGVYTLLDKCGTANGALHKMQSEATDLPPLFMLFDPHRTNDSKDCFVFSISTRRLEYEECRPIIGQLDPKWRQSSKEEEQTVSCHLPFKWVESKSVSIEPSIGQNAKYAVPAHGLEIPSSKDACRNAYALLTCKVSLRGQAGPEWSCGKWLEVDKIHERGTFKSLAWLLERIRQVDDSLHDWQEVETPESHLNCERCAPTAPELHWVFRDKKFVAVEDPVQAGEYERRLKSRPSPFVTQLKLAEDGTGFVRVGINIPSLLHRAVSRLPTKNRTERITLSGRLDTNFTPAATQNLPKFVILSNKRDKEHDQPPNFKIPLRKEQLRSLEWMIHQEFVEAPPFIEEEISEAILDPLGWRAEGRAQRPRFVRGGVLADQVGYGKTAITLGLIDCMSKNVDKEFSKKGRVAGKINVKATLIIVPPHLTRQWDSEVKKFTGNRFKVVVISTVSNLNSVKIEDIQKADIVIVASNIFKSSAYLDNLQTLAGGGDLPSKDGRHFTAQLEKNLIALKDQVERLQEEGSLAVLKEIKESQKRLQEDAAAAAALIASKRLKGKSYREAAEAKERDPEKGKKLKVKAASLKKEESQDPATPSNPTASRTPSGLIVEVVIPVSSKEKADRNNASSATSSPARDGEAESEGSNSRKRKRRAATKNVIVISDDESGSEVTGKNDGEGTSTKSSRASAASSRKRPRIMRRGSPSSDYQASSEEEQESEDSDVRMESDDENDESVEEESDDGPRSKKAKGKGKAKAKPIPKPKPQPIAKGRGKSSTKTEESEPDNDDMDVDEPSTKGGKKKATKRKAAGDDARPAKKAKRADNDPWNLGSKPVRMDWTDMQAPPFEMFHFSRVVVDEYTYLDGKIHALVTHLTSDRQWVLSGTPPIHDFAALKTIAAFLDIHLGVDDDGEGQSAEVKKRLREKTAVERFHSFREVHSPEWHAHRHQLGQAFLDQFVRQNIAEIDEIPWVEKTQSIILPAAERAIYLELEHHLRSLDMTIKRGKKTDSDREKRLAQSLGESKSAEEALLKRCSHFDLETSEDNAMKACDVIVRERQKQLDACKAQLLKAIKEGVKREKALGNVGQESMFIEYVRVSRTEGVDDQESTDMVIALLDEAGAGMPKAKTKAQDVHLSEKTKAAVWDHREKTHEIRRITKELVGRVRSLRYFSVVRDLQKQTATPLQVSCPGCKREKIPINEVAVLSSCGHTGCLNCVRTCAEKEECVYAVLGQCKSAARVLNVVKGDTLGVDDEARKGKDRHFGMKLEKVVDLIKKQISKEERVLVFVQFPDLMTKVTEAFKEHRIKFLEIKGSANAKSKNLEQFQNESEERVLLLNVMDESASGANLTSANHAIFLSPLLAPSQEIYTACETQAVGRLVRYGQMKHVSVWRFLTKDTIDEEIYEQRHKAMVHAH